VNPKEILDQIERIGGPGYQEMLDRAVVAYNHTWQVICQSEIMKKTKLGGSDLMSPFEVMAACEKFVHLYGLDAPAHQWYRSFPVTIRVTLIKVIFPFQNYGL
jgi:hypothetical protein